MSNYIPTKLKDLTESKQRVMRNVLNEIENVPKSPKYKWRYVVISTALILSVMLFVFNEVLIEHEPHSATEQHLDFTKPVFSNVQGTFSLHGLTLGDSQSKVIDLFGENYTIEKEDESRADLILNYEGIGKFYFIDDKLDSIVFLNVNGRYFDKLFNEFDGFKFFTSMNVDYDGRFFYSKETNQILKATPENAEGSLTLSLYYPDQFIQEKAEFLSKVEQNIKNEQQSQSNTTNDIAIPTYSELQGTFYLNGITIGDTPSNVIEQLGGRFIIGYVDADGWDFVIDYEDVASFSFYEGKLKSAVFKNVDQSLFNLFFESYDGIKLVDSPRTVDSDRYLYSKETGQLIKATTNVPNEALYLYLFPGGKDLLDNPEFNTKEVLD